MIIENGKITRKLGEHFDLALELVEVTKLGYAPQIIYDDDGSFAVVDEGSWSIRVDENSDFSATVFGEASAFRDTPQQAWDAWLVSAGLIGDEFAGRGVAGD